MTHCLQLEFPSNMQPHVRNFMQTLLDDAQRRATEMIAAVKAADWEKASPAYVACETAISRLLQELEKIPALAPNEGPALSATA